MKRFTVFTVLMFAVVCAVLFLEGGFAIFKSFLGFSAFLIVVGVPFFATLGAWSIKDLGAMWRDAFSDRKSASMEASQNILLFNEKLYYVAGITGTLLGFVLILSGIGPDMGIAMIGRACAASLLATVYGLLFGIVARIMHARIGNTLSK